MSVFATSADGTRMAYDRFGDGPTVRVGRRVAPERRLADHVRGRAEPRT
jgi:hypothetical protein